MTSEVVEEGVGGWAGPASMKKTCGSAEPAASKEIWGPVAETGLESRRGIRESRCLHGKEYISGLGVGLGTENRFLSRTCSGFFFLNTGPV